MKRLTRFGALKVLREKLPTECIVHELRNGVMIQAGPDPITGDITKKESMELYKAVDAVLAPLRIPEEVWGPDGFYHDEFLEDWTRRFD